MEYVTARDVAIPVLGLGTWDVRGEGCRRAVEGALELGNRHADTAQMYDNEAEVGAAIADAPTDRDEVFLVTKVSGRNLAREAPAVGRSKSRTARDTRRPAPAPLPEQVRADRSVDRRDEQAPARGRRRPRRRE